MIYRHKLTQQLVKLLHRYVEGMCNESKYTTFVVYETDDGILRLRQELDFFQNYKLQ